MNMPTKPYEMFTVRSVPPEHETGARGSAARYTTQEQTEEIHLHISTGGASIIYLTKEQAKAFFDLEDKPVLKLHPEWHWTYIFDGCKYLSKSMPEKCDEGYADMGWEYIKSPFTNDLGKPEESLHQIIDGKLVKYVDIPEDGEPILAHSTEARMISAGKLDNGGWLLCYAGQGNKFTSMGRTVPIRVWRRPTEEELK